MVRGQPPPHSCLTGASLISAIHYFVASRLGGISEDWEAENLCIALMSSIVCELRRDGAVMLEVLETM